MAGILHCLTRSRISDIPVTIKGRESSPLWFTTSWSELYGKKFTVLEETSEGITVATRKINPETARALLENIIA